MPTGHSAPTVAVHEFAFIRRGAAASADVIAVIHADVSVL